MASGHDVPKPRKENHPNRQVHRGRFEGHHPMDYAEDQGWYADEEAASREAVTRARLEDEYGGGAGDWD